MDGEQCLSESGSPCHKEIFGSPINQCQGPARTDHRTSRVADERHDFRERKAQLVPTLEDTVCTEDQLRLGSFLKPEVPTHRGPAQMVRTGLVAKRLVDTVHKATIPIANLLTLLPDNTIYA